MITVCGHGVYGNSMWTLGVLKLCRHVDVRLQLADIGCIMCGHGMYGNTCEQGVYSKCVNLGVYSKCLDMGCTAIVCGHGDVQ